MLQNLVDHGPGMRTVSLLRSRVTLHAMPTSAGYEIRENAVYSWDGRTRGNTPFTVLQHTISGRGSLRYENRTMRIEAGETLLLLIPHNHRYWLEDGDRWEYFWISMNGIEALRIHEMVLNAQGPVLRLKSETIDRIAACTLRLMRGEGETPGHASAIAYEASMHLYDDAFGPSERILREQNAITRTLQYISQNLGNDLTVDILAQVAGLSRAHMIRAFRKHYFITPHAFQTDLRIRHARHLLRCGATPSDTAQACGFADQAHLTRQFKARTGLTPAVFRAG